MIFYDLETTGVNVMTARIIELYAFNRDRDKELHLFLNPTIPIPKEASDAHHYTNDMVKDWPTFKEKSKEIYEFFHDELGNKFPVCGYNNKGYDDLIMFMEFQRAGLKYDLDSLVSADYYEIWNGLEKRTLGGAYQRFCNKSSEELHGAKEDVNVLMQVSAGLIDTFTEEAVENFVNKPGEEKEICYGQLTKDSSGALICNFGNKYKGVPISDIQRRDPGYLKWIINESNMSGNLKFLIYKETQSK
jgi:DNA polymerase-3 subunit epsilon